jgi:hypothetical protein
VRVRLGGLTLWRFPSTMGKAVFTVRPHFVLRDRQMRPEGGSARRCWPHTVGSVWSGAP